VEIRLADTVLANAPVTMTARVTTRPLPAILDLVTATAEAHYLRIGHAFVIVRGRVAPSAPPSLHPVRPESQYGR
jgi:hypothetical protein